jgi:hypothetical protein
MSAEYERRLLARARELVDVSEIKYAALACLSAGRHAGLDPEALAGLVGCAAALGATSLETYSAGDGWEDSHADDRHFLAHVSSIEDDIEERLSAAVRLGRETAAALEAAREDLDAARHQLAAARHQLAAAHAMPVYRPCEGCHARRARAIEDTQEAIADAEALIAECEIRTGICEDISQALRVLRPRVQRALDRIRAVPSDLGETYESVYNLIRRGGHMPHEGRWITGETPIPA